MKISAFLATVALSAIAAPASAATYIITYTGTVAGSNDQTGVFGGFGSSLNGKDFTAIYTLTAPLAGAQTYDDGSTAFIQGGTTIGAASPLSGTLTINGVSRSIEANYFSIAQQDNGVGGRDKVYHSVVYDDIGGTSTGSHNQFFTTIGSSVNDFLTTQNYTAPTTYYYQAGDEHNGYFQFLTTYNANVISHAYGYLRPTSVTIAAAPVNGVPEPATWAMMIAGFGLVGGAMRRRQAQQMRFNFA